MVPACVVDVVLQVVVLLVLLADVVLMVHFDDGEVLPEATVCEVPIRAPEVPSPPPRANSATATSVAARLRPDELPTAARASNGANSAGAQRDS